MEDEWVNANFKKILFLKEYDNKSSIFFEGKIFYIPLNIKTLLWPPNPKLFEMA